jgi:transcriptional antiterminator NusG
VGKGMALRWYVVHAYSNFENKVKQALEDRIKREGLEQYFGKILVPTEVPSLFYNTFY